MSNKSDSPEKNIWTSYQQSPGKTCHWQIGTFELWLQQNKKEWLCATGDTDDEFALVIDETPKPDDKEWNRWAYSSTCKSFSLEPVLPDRPLVARPLSPITILPDQTAQFFISVPLWVRLIIPEKKPVTLAEWPTLTLSSSWFGTPMEGELCYALKTRAKVSVDDIDSKPFRAICPLTIKNESDEPLKFERLCLHGDFLNVYRGDSHMWTSHGSFIYKGPSQNSQVTFGKNAPKYDNASAIIGKARQEPRGLASRSFENLKLFTTG